MTATTNNTVFAARDAKNKFGQLLDAAQRRPVTIQKKGRNVAVVLAYDVYEELQKLDDAYWGERAMEIKECGDFLGVEESETLLSDLLHEKD